MYVVISVLKLSKYVLNYYVLRIKKKVNLKIDIKVLSIQELNN